MWKSEKLFGKVVMEKIEAESGICFRLETASTAPGMPDLYVLANGADYFIEFKNMQNTPVVSSHFKVAWRAGQQRFALQYREKMQKFKQVYYDDADDTYIEGFEQKFSWTFVGCSNGVLLIPMYQVFENNLVRFDDAVFTFTLDEFRKLNILEFLRAHSQVFVPTDDHSDYVNRILTMQNYWLNNMFFKCAPAVWDYISASDILANHENLFRHEHCSYEMLLKQYYAVADDMLECYHAYIKNS